MTNSTKVLVGTISRAHGVRGLIKVVSFTTNPSDIFAYGELYDETLTRTFSFKRLGINKNVLLCQIEGVTDRTSAEHLCGTNLYALRKGLPTITEEGTYYHTDLIGLKVLDSKNTEHGKISSIFNFGAGDILNITDSSGKSVMVPFTEKDVPIVDINGGFIKITSNTWFKNAKVQKRGNKNV